jgi:hypothetical protein
MPRLTTRECVPAKHLYIYRPSLDNLFHSKHCMCCSELIERPRSLLLFILSLLISAGKIETNNDILLVG